MTPTRHLRSRRRRRTSYDADDLVIARGHAQEALATALDALVAAYAQVEAVSMALARQLDATAEARTP
jgi:hypothetical protein